MLRPYQQRAVADVCQAWQQGARRVCMVLPTGAGKTITAKAISDVYGGRILWLTHRREIKDQAPGDAVTIQSLLSGARPPCDLLVADECFPCTTLIGETNINSIVVGDRVPAWDEHSRRVVYGKVSRVFVRRPKAMVRIFLADGRQEHCTVSHPFWARGGHGWEGWASAINLAGSEVACYTTAHVLQARPGQEEGRTPGWVRVDSVEILEPGSDGTFGGVCPDGLVYNIEVEKFHTYLADGLVVHNCHHLAPGAEKWHSIAQHYPRILGLTATPQRSDGSALGDLFDHLIVGAHYSELLRGGWLVPAKTFRPKEDLQGGVAESPAKAWMRLAGGARGFAFFSRVEYAQKFTDEVNRDREISRSVWGEQDPASRAEALRLFREGKLQCLSNVQILTEGVDIPEAKVCLLATGCDHAGGYLQRVGRVLRPAPGKTSALLIDLTGASHRFGLPHEDREYSLDGRAIKCKVEALRVCQQCGHTYPRAVGACPECGFLLPPKPSRLNVVGCSLEEVIESGDPKQKRIAKAVKAKWGDASRGALRAEYQKWVAIANAKGYKPGWAKVRFKMVTGRWPDAGLA